MIKIGNYILTASSWTHNQLLYRYSSNKSGENYDLLFSGTTEIKLPFRFDIKSLLIEKLDDDSEMKRVVIFHEGGEGTLICNKVQYQINKLSPNESSIPSDLSPPLTETDIANMYLELTKIGNDQFKSKYLDVEDDWEELILGKIYNAT